MKRQRYAILSALFVIGLTAGLIAMAQWLSGVKSQPMRAITIETRGSVMGLARGAPVLYRGIQAGHVTHIGFDPQDPNVILIQALIHRDTPLVPGTRAHLATSLFSSSATISLSPPAQAVHGPYHPPHPYPHTLRMSPSHLSMLVTDGATSARHLAVVTQRLETLLSPKNLATIRQTLKRLDQSLSTTQRIAYHLDQAARALPGTQRALTHLLDSTQLLVQKTGTVPAAFRHTLSATRALERALATETLPELNRSLRSLGKASANLASLSHTLDRYPQAWLLGRPRSTRRAHHH